MKTLAKILAILGMNYLLIFKLPKLLYMTTGVSPKVINPGNITQFSLLATAVIYMLVRKKTPGSMGFKLCPGKTAAKAWGIGTSVGLAGMALMMIIATFWLKITPEGKSPGMPGNLLRDILDVWIIASLFEEIYYRGFVMDWLSPLKDKGINVLGKKLSLPVILAAFLFGISHLCLLTMLPYQMVTGVVINGIVLSLFAGYFKEKSGSLIPAYLIHLMFNVMGKAVTALGM